MITIELFGVPRLRAGTAPGPARGRRRRLGPPGLAPACPGLDGSVVHRGRVHPAYRLSLNGERFVSDPATPLADGDVLLLLSADVGG